MPLCRPGMNTSSFLSPETSKKTKNTSSCSACPASVICPKQTPKEWAFFSFTSLVSVSYFLYYFSGLKFFQSLEAQAYGVLFLPLPLQ
jgi:hypothetical protein